MSMKILATLPLVALPGWVLAGPGSVSADEGPRPITISGRVLGASGAHAVYVLLWDAPGFLKQPVRRLELPSRSEHAFSFSVAPGRWAVSAFEDRNGNGVLDMGLFGPEEPSGFWRPIRAWRRPRFGDVASQIDQNVSDVIIKLR